jgi:hypothetical protein
MKGNRSHGTIYPPPSRGRGLKMTRDDPIRSPYTFQMEYAIYIYIYYDNVSLNFFIVINREAIMPPIGQYVPRITCCP